MTIKTLEIIHKALEDECRRLKGGYELARDVANKAEESEAVNAKSLREAADSMYRNYCKAANALEEFEEQDFR